MGGIGSGARRSKHVGNVEKTLAIDIRALRRLGSIQPGECVINAVQWSNGGLSAPRARLRVDLSDIERGGVMTLDAHMFDGVVRQRVAVDAVPTSLGGWRCYFICPVDGARCEILYYHQGRFACRSAQRLSYAVQSMTDLSRVRRKAAKLRARLDGEGIFCRTRGNRRMSTVKRLRAAEFEAREIYLDRLRSQVDGSGSQRIPRTKIERP